MNLSVIDFAPLIMAITASVAGLAFVKTLVYLHRKQLAHPATKQAGMRRHSIKGTR